MYSFFFLFSPWLQTSDTHAKLIEILEKTNFITQEFILSPLQFGIPYSRPRYFCLVGILFRNANECFEVFGMYFNWCQAISFEICSYNCNPAFVAVGLITLVSQQKLLLITRFTNRVDCGLYRISQTVRAKVVLVVPISSMRVLAS